tara:strand:+ start:143 stop:433 length:291 start_codon:yes stop_codon:yes gene_type:complete
MTDTRVPIIKKGLKENKNANEIMKLAGIKSKSTYYSICKRNKIKLNNTRGGRPLGSYDKTPRKKRGSHKTGGNIEVGDLEEISLIDDLQYLKSIAQ